MTFITHFDDFQDGFFLNGNFLDSKIFFMVDIFVAFSHSAHSAIAKTEKFTPLEVSKFKLFQYMTAVCLQFCAGHGSHAEIKGQHLF